MAEKQQDLTERLNKIVKKERDEDRALGPAAPRKPIGKTRGMAWVNSTGGVSTASAGGSSSGGSGGSGGPSKSGDSGGSSTGFPGDADNSMNYGGGGGGGGYREPTDPTDPDSGYEPVPPDGTEAGTNDMTADDPWAASTDGGMGSPSGFTGKHCASGKDIRLGVDGEGQHIPPEGFDPDNPQLPSGGWYSEGASESWHYYSGFTEWVASIPESPAFGWPEPAHYEYDVWDDSGTPRVRRKVVGDETSTVYSVLNDYAHASQFSCPTGISPGSPPDYSGICEIPVTEYEPDGTCNLQIIDGLFVPDPDDPDCDGLAPQRCYLVSSSCPAQQGDPASGTMVCALDDGGLILSEWQNGAPKVGGISKTYHRDPANPKKWKMKASFSNSNRDDYLYR